MYLPRHFDASSDLAFCHRLIGGYPFAPIITGAAVSHVPWLVDETRGAKGTLLGHVARASPHADLLGAPGDSLVIFTGPHAYVSPTWYAAYPAVPTWNYCAVHASGPTRILDDGETRTYLSRLAAQFDATWRMEAQPRDYQDRMVGGIVAFELAIDKLEGKAKLSQNRAHDDIVGVIAALEKSATPGDREVASWMRERSSGD